jgi:anti-anti-sigma factor
MRVSIPEFARPYLSPGTLGWKGTDSVRSDDSESIDKAGINIVPGKDGALACLSGRIDIDSSPAVRGRLLALLQPPKPKMVSIDLSEVTHIDSSGVATLIEALRIARSCETELRLQGLQGRLLRLFESTGILALFNGSVPR